MHTRKPHVKAGPNGLIAIAQQINETLIKLNFEGVDCDRLIELSITTLMTLYKRCVFYGPLRVFLINDRLVKRGI